MKFVKLTYLFTLITILCLVSVTNTFEEMSFASRKPSKGNAVTRKHVSKVNSSITNEINHKTYRRRNRHNAAPQKRKTDKVTNPPHTGPQQTHNRHNENLTVKPTVNNKKNKSPSSLRLLTHTLNVSKRKRRNRLGKNEKLHKKSNKKRNKRKESKRNVKEAMSLDNIYLNFEKMIDKINPDENDQNNNNNNDHNVANDNPQVSNNGNAIQFRKLRRHI